MSIVSDKSAFGATPTAARPGQADCGNRLTSMLAPAGIAIVGASDNSGWSRYTYANLVQGKYPHAIHLVNHRSHRVHGQPAVTSLREIGERVDLAYVLTGPASLPSIMADAAAAGVPNLVVIAAGFGETGDAGHERERQLADLARSYDQLILGPNNLGFINTPDATMPWSQMMPWPLQSGGVGVMSQSGAAQVREMLGEPRSFSLLSGARGTQPVDLDELSRVIARIGDVAVALGDKVEELEVNPLRAAGSRIEVLDALARWRSATSVRATDLAAG